MMLMLMPCHVLMLFALMMTFSLMRHYADADADADADAMLLMMMLSMRCHSLPLRVAFDAPCLRCCHAADSQQDYMRARC